MVDCRTQLEGGKDPHPPSYLGLIFVLEWSVEPEIRNFFIFYKFVRAKVKRGD